MKAIRSMRWLGINNRNKNMISINRKEGYICISRCEYLYRDGAKKRDEKANGEMGDGDILIPLPKYMCSGEWDNCDDGKGRTKGSDGQSAEIIIKEIQKRLRKAARAK